MEKVVLKMILRELRIIINLLLSLINLLYTIHFVAGWQSGYAAACKAVYAGSIPASASKENIKLCNFHKLNFVQILTKYNKGSIIKP